MKRNLYLGTVAILLVLLVGAGYWYFANVRPQQAERAWNEYLEAYRRADAVHHSGTYDESLAAFEELLPRVPTQAAATQVKFVIASDLFARNQGDDRVRAVEMYKEIILDESNFPFQRAVAISELMGLNIGTHDENFARTAIFRGEPFEKFIDEAAALNYRQDISYAVRRALEMGEELYPLALSEFRIAGWYFGALDSGLVRDERQRTELVAELKEWTEKGEANISDALRIGFEQTRIAEMYQQNAGARRALARHGDGRQNYDLAEAAFQNALQALAADPGPHTFGVGMFVRFHYAAMLAELYGAERRADVEELVRGMVNVPAEFRNRKYVFYEFLENEVASEHDTHGHKQDLVRLSQMVPQFRTFLEARGIRY